jgi:hypothetical protein
MPIGGAWVRLWGSSEGVGLVWVERRAGLSEILCSGHGMTTRDMYAKQAQVGQTNAAERPEGDY